MEFDLATAQQWVARLIGAAIIVQSLELLALRREFSGSGVWSWRVVRRELDGWPGSLRWLADRLMGHVGFGRLIVVQILAGLVLLWSPHPLALAFGFAVTLLVSVRFRGAFNGGSDSMTLIVLGSSLVATIGPSGSAWAHVGLWYIGVQVVASYFVAGVAKVSHRSWREGRALSAFLTTAVYAPPAWLTAMINRRGAALAASWAVICFELAFPLALIGPRWCLGFVMLALPFHLANAALFGLNRFVLAWAATYPALMWCAATGLG